MKTGALSKTDASRPVEIELSPSIEQGSTLSFDFVQPIKRFMGKAQKLRGVYGGLPMHAASGVPASAVDVTLRFAADKEARRESRVTNGCICSKCGKAFQVTPEELSRLIMVRRSDGIRPKCDKCGGNAAALRRAVSRT